MLKSAHYYRQDKETGKVEEITRTEAIAILMDYYKDAFTALDNSSIYNKLQTDFSLYWEEES